MDITTCRDVNGEYIILSFMNVVSFLEMQHYGFSEYIILSFMNVVSFLEMQHYGFSEWILLHVEMLMVNISYYHL
jgi:hypothetical protein